MHETYEFEHSVGANLDYGFNWVAKGWLAVGETITSSSWSVPVTITKSAEQSVGGVTSAYFLCATTGVHKLTNSITTSQGRSDSRTMTLICKQR